MKAKQLSKRLRSRSDELRRMALSFQNGDQVSADRARLLADVLQEVADQVAPASTKRGMRPLLKLLVYVVEAYAVWSIRRRLDRYTQHTDSSLVSFLNSP